MSATTTLEPSAHQKVTPPTNRRHETRDDSLSCCPRNLFGPLWPSVKSALIEQKAVGVEVDFNELGGPFYGAADFAAWKGVTAAR